MQRALLIFLVAGSYLLYAGARPWAMAPLLTLAALAALANPRRTFTFPRASRAIDLSLIALVAGMALQVLPLPPAIFRQLSPHAGRVRTSLQFSPLTPAPDTWLPLSINSEASITALATVALGILTFWVARALFGAGGHTRAFCRAATLIGAAAAILAIVQKAIAPRLVLFTLASESRSANPFGAFINRNHMAAWLLMVAALVGGYLIARVRISPDFRGRWRPAFKHFLVSGAALNAIGLMLIVGVLLLTLSRSAVAGLGVATLVAWRFGRPRMRIERTSLPSILGMAGLLLVGAMLFVDLDGWASRLEQGFGEPGEAGRTTIWRETVPVVRDFWLTGTGAGTYSDAMTQYQQSRIWVASMQRWAHFNNAHSHYLQVLTEGGLLLALPVLAALLSLATVTRRAVRADKGEMFWVRVGAAAGLAGIAAQSVWETSLIMPANAVMAGVLAGLAVHRRDGSRSEPSTTQELITPRPVPARTF